jgi:hypothetical protein
MATFKIKGRFEEVENTDGSKGLIFVFCNGSLDLKLWLSYPNKEEALIGAFKEFAEETQETFDQCVTDENKYKYEDVYFTVVYGSKNVKRKNVVKVDRHAVYAKYNNNCAYCGNRLEFKDMQVDHFVPKTKFQGEGADELENLMPSCKECNMDKGNMLIDEWRERLHNASETVKSSKILASALKFNMIEIKPFDGKFYYETN